MENETTTYLNSYELLFNGVYGRNRKVKFQIVKLKRTLASDSEQPSEHDLRNMTQAAFAQIGAKTGTYKVVKRPIERNGIFESTILFSETDLFSGVL